MYTKDTFATIAVAVLWLSSSAAFGASISVTSPNGGETWAPGTTHNITWTATDVPGNVKIYLYHDWTKIRVLATASATLGTWSWSLPGDEPAYLACRIRVSWTTDTAVGDYSDDTFVVGTPQSIRVVSPNGGEIWAPGTARPIVWTASGVAGNVLVYLYSNWTQLRLLATVAANEGSWTWNIPADEPLGSAYRIRVRSQSTSTVGDYGDGLFALAAPSIQVTYPNGGESLIRGTEDKIMWKAPGLTGNVRIYLYDNWTKLRTLATVPAEAGQHTLWAIPKDEPCGSTYRIRVQWLVDTSINDYGDGLFSTVNTGQQTILLPGGVPLEMAWIPAGSFQMGRYPGESESEVTEDPQHLVTFATGFWLGKYEVTKAQWQTVMGTTPWAGQWGVWDDPGSPAEYVSWDAAQAFVQTLNATSPLGVHLPSEAQWEYACRAGTTTRFYWGDDPDYTLAGQYAWFSDNTYQIEDYAHVVGQKLPNAWGLYDMSGNAWEWCQDYFHGNYIGAPADGSAWETPTSGFRVRRGGAWNELPLIRSASRGWVSPAGADYAYGLRLAR